MPTPTPIVLPQFDAATNTVTYLLACPRTGAAAIIDPVLDYEPKGARISHASARQLLATVRERGWQLHWLLETHPHADHLSAGDWLRSQTGARLAISRHITQVQALFAPRFGMDALPCDGPSSMCCWMMAMCCRWATLASRCCTRPATPRPV